MDNFSALKCVFFDTSFETLPQTVARAPRAPKIVVFPSKYEQKVARKLTHLSSLCSLRNMCGELATIFALCVLSFSLQNQGESHARALAHIFRAAPMSRR